jgi:hypothetical protein
MRPLRRTVSETPLFQKQLAEFGDARFTDRVLDQAKDKVSMFPYEFPELVPNSNIRHVKTEDYFHEGRIIPALKIWFVIIDENRVELIGVTRVSDDDFDEFIF